MFSGDLSSTCLICSPGARRAINENSQFDQVLKDLHNCAHLHFSISVISPGVSWPSSLPWGCQVKYFVNLVENKLIILFYPRKSTCAIWRPKQCLRAQETIQSLTCAYVAKQPTTMLIYVHSINFIIF